MKQRRSELATSSLEAADGSRFQFTQHDAVEGAPADQFKGVAVKGQATDGSVTYEDGSARSAALPRDAIFPTEHMKALLGAAEAGKTALSVVVFDGADKGKVYHATAIIGRKSVDAKGAPKGLEGRAHWPVSISYFPLSSTLPTPRIRNELRPVRQRRLDAPYHRLWRVRSARRTRWRRLSQEASLPRQIEGRGLSSFPAAGLRRWDGRVLPRSRNRAASSNHLRARLAPRDRQTRSCPKARQTTTSSPA